MVTARWRQARLTFSLFARDRSSYIEDENDRVNEKQGPREGKRSTVREEQIVAL